MICGNMIIQKASDLNVRVNSKKRQREYDEAISSSSNGFELNPDVPYTHRAVYKKK